ncbi:hypothetical protein H6F43_19310 [Leptolyngbya sp. FACHB-36]|uniref:type IV pilin-like G/H family protein n=1 Tax=Leptolyngbya sp. FACHB-36 TaxID=2692808 RepID=UPI0016805160|nr:hypothetical protein [Leptolyngbya sp. FACHB-36]
MNPIVYQQRRANAWVTHMNQTQSNLLLRNKGLMLFLQEKRCLQQDEAYIFVCRTSDGESAFPKALNYALARNSDLKSYVGGVFIGVMNGKKTAQMIVCEAQSSGTQLLQEPIDEHTCGSGSIRVKERDVP